MKGSVNDGVLVILAAAVLMGSIGLCGAEGQNDAGVARGNRAAERATARAAAKEKAAARLEGAKEQREAAREKTLEAKDKASEAGSARGDKRQDNQGKRIQQGIAKGYLTADEIAKLNAQQQLIVTLETSLKSDGKLTAGEFRTITAALNEASRCIWAEKHDTDGNQMPTYRLGRNVFAKNELTSKLGDENLSVADAKSLLRDFHRTVELKRKLSTGDLSSADRVKLQTEYDELLNKYFEVK